MVQPNGSYFGRIYSFNTSSDWLKISILFSWHGLLGLLKLLEVIIQLEVGLSCVLGILGIWVDVDNSWLYVLDHHNIGIGGAVDVVVSQHLIRALDVVLTLFPLEWDHPS